ncbi:hypothetical protein JCM3774_005027 [Rhodotorula dairenensis]
MATLPPPVLDRVLEHAFTLDRQLVPAALAHLGTHGHDSARRVLAHSLVLHDDDDLLAEAQEQHSASATSLLARVLNSPDWASQVRQVSVVNPDTTESALPRADPDDERQENARAPPPPMDDAAFFLCLSRFENLTSFTWHSHRVPPPQLCLALGQAAKNLTHFRLELVVPPPAASGAVVVPSSPTLLQPQAAGPTSPSLVHSPLLGSGSGGTVVSNTVAGAARWDAPHLAALPDKLTHLSLSSLSASGARTLADDALASSLGTSLEHLELAKTLFVDDQVLAAVGEHAKGLQTLKVREMAGTKLSELGLKHVLDGCPELTELHLDGVQGRFSRACWQKLTPLPANLRVLRLSYSELGPHKSWLLDHLASLEHLVSPTNSSLRSLALTRTVASRNALVPGSHHLARYPIDPALEPRALADRDLDALVGGKGQDLRGGGPGPGPAREWESLELDLFKVEPDQLKRLLEGCPRLKRLRVLFDAPFRNLLTLAPSFAACPDLQHFVLAIPPGHSPEMAGVTPAEYLAAVAPLFGDDAAGGADLEAVASNQAESPTREYRRRRGSRSGANAAGSASAPAAITSPAPSLTPIDTAAVASCVHHPLEALDSLLPPTKDWRRFLKKAHALERVSWAGRGGLGTWDFSQKQGSSLARVEFRPTRPPPLGTEADLNPGAAAAPTPAEGQGIESPSSPTRSARTRTASSSGGGDSLNGGLYGSWDGSRPSAARGRRRRSSSVSLAGSCLSNLSLSSTPGGGGGPLSTLSSPATPFSTLMGLGIPSSSPSATSGGAGWAADALSCSPPEYQTSFTGPHANGAGGRRRSSATSNSMFGAIGNTTNSSTAPSNSFSAALGLTVPLAEEDPALPSSKHQTQDLFGWAADTAAATALERAPPASSPSSPPRKDNGGAGKAHHGKANSSSTHQTTPSLLPPKPAHLPPKPLSFAAAVGAAGGGTRSPAPAAPAAAAAMARTASGTSAASSVSAISGSGSGGSRAATGDSSTSSGALPALSRSAGGRNGHAGASGGAAGGGGSGGGGGGARSNRSRGKSASPKQEKNAHLPQPGTGGGENRRSSGGSAGGAGGTGSRKNNGGGGGGRRREATR